MPGHPRDAALAPRLLRSLRRALTSASKAVGLTAINLSVVRRQHDADLIEMISSKCCEQVRSVDQRMRRRLLPAADKPAHESWGAMGQGLPRCKRSPRMPFACHLCRR